MLIMANLFNSLILLQITCYYYYYYYYITTDRSFLTLLPIVHANSYSKNRFKNGGATLPLPHTSSWRDVYFISCPVTLLKKTCGPKREDGMPSCRSDIQQCIHAMFWLETPKETGHLKVKAKDTSRA
jgi:hypothetical protein